MEGFFGVSGPVIFGAKAQNGKVTVKLTASMPGGNSTRPANEVRTNYFFLVVFLVVFFVAFLAAFLAAMVRHLLS